MFHIARALALKSLNVLTVVAVVEPPPARSTKAKPSHGRFGRGRAFSRFVGWASAIATGLFILCAFAPFVSWAPALLWLLVVGITLVNHERHKARPLAVGESVETSPSAV